jgi:hypothetical protein
MAISSRARTVRVSFVLSLALLGGCGGEVTAGADGGISTTAAGGNSTGGAGGTSSTGGGAGTTTSTDCGPCDWECCGAQCVNKGNDIKNCGACGEECAGPNPYCDKGVCGVPPCEGAQCGPAGLCCGAACCATGELCCTVPGPVGDMTSCLPPDENGTCPTGCATCQCNSPETPIATPDGERRIADIRVGDLVYSVHDGAIVAVPVVAVQRVPAPAHVVRRVTLEGGRVLEVSAAHPTADGRHFSDLRAGGELDGIPIVAASTIPFAHDATFDILPASSTGTYFAAGARIGSTLVQGAASKREVQAPENRGAHSQ